MEHFIVSARKYRPQTFLDVIGQQSITNTLENAIKNNHLAQALLFTGPRGVGKTTCARILAKRINQESMDQVPEDEDFAFNIFELDAASNNSVDDIRSLTEQVRIPPQTGKYKVYIIDEVHMLSQSAFNAFLKTLEEPPAHTIFILATTEKHKIIPTILSRCQIFDFKRIGVIDIKNYLHTIAKQENITADDDALHIIAQKADGALRDALSIFDRVVSFSGNNLTREAVTENLNVLDYEVYFKITDLLLNNQIPEVLLAFNEVLDKGFDGHHFITGLASHFRDVLVAKDSSTIALLEVGDRAKNKYLEQAVKATVPFLMEAIDLANQCDLNYKASKNQRLLVELALMQIASINFDREKKKSERFIIPAQFFSHLEVQERLDVPTSEPNQSQVPPIPKPKAAIDIKVSQYKEKILVTEKVEEIKIINPVLKGIKATSRKSALSMSSIERKKLEEADLNEKRKERERLLQSKTLPKDDFTEEQFFNIWESYIDSLHENGEKIFASILNADKPVLVKQMIHVTYSNNLMKSELEKVKPKALQFIREKLNNYSIDFVVHINEEETNKIAYTNQEKYEHLKEKNKALSYLRKEFKLDI
ncbi:DNA polymerase III subunit gamma/tau [Namhaeicola litoreus]|uniref:DNA polymerase III subunit gamma/tau n=1 Tax=Namhaeicola litoreus TaxID=1052145 RepID=A0ABW3Y531_9FLAO